jgi:GH15 family glucan-1,4-alpha-glucosidase
VERPQPVSGAYQDEVRRSLIVLKAMTYETTGALIAAPTTSLPEDLGGLRNWDYRYCWLRDSVLALEALIAAEYADEAMAFRDFLLRIATGDPSKLQIMYGIGGERRLTSSSCPDCRDTRSPDPCESATRHPNSSNWMSTVRS